jgi:glyoxylase-like metal-dependent hydrolase (beta-lactamase superfamily II)
MIVQHFHDERTATLTYVVHDPHTRLGVAIDTVTDYDPKSGRLSNGTNEKVAAYVDERKIELRHVLDTHAHADHVTGMPFFEARYGARSAIGARIVDVQRKFSEIFNLGAELPADGSQFDRLLEDGDELEVGGLRILAMHTPGHTPACMSYRIGDAVFVGDAIFEPDYGCARCDFPGGSAVTLYRSIQALYRLPDETRVFTGHDYRPGGRALRFQSTIAAQKASNVQIPAWRSQADFVALREERDRQLELPALILPAIQLNIRAGRHPLPEANGVSYLKIPLNVF